jgi:fumarate reductase flavoprotein subunit
VTRARGTPAGADVIVVGAGLAGIAAALAAAERGATVCLLEKEHAVGGSSVMAGGGLAFAGTPLQGASGVVDTPEQLRQAILEAGQYRNDPVAVDVYIRNQLATYEWLSGHGLNFTLGPANTDVPMPRIHAGPPGSLTRLLLERFVASGRGLVCIGTPALKLLTGSGKVIGVQVSHEGRQREISARHGVVLATGGFARSPELIATFAPRWLGAVVMSGAGTTGDGLRMAIAHRAKLVDMDCIEATFGASDSSFPGLADGHGKKTAPRLLFPNAAGAIVVNSTGRRFVNESLNYKIIGAACARQPGGAAFQVFDQTVMRRSQPVPSPRDFARALADGLLVTAPTPGALASLLGMDPAVLQATVAEYNSFARAGTDPAWGRPVGGSDIVAGPIESPPFYGYPCRPGLTATYCGVRIDSQLRIIDIFGQPIHGLFAAGEVVGGFHGAGYLTGTALGKAAVFGRQAGIEALVGSSQAATQAGSALARASAAPPEHPTNGG